MDGVIFSGDKEFAARVAGIMFADFVIDNRDLFHQVESSFRAGNRGGSLDLLIELERKAQGRQL